MSERTAVERVLDAFLAEGPETVSDDALLRTLDAVDLTRQRHRLTVPWRLPQMNLDVRFVAVAAAVLIAVGGAFYVSRPRNDAVGPQSTPTESPSPQVVQPPEAQTWIQTISDQYGYSFATPPGWNVLRADEPWAGQTDDEMWSFEPYAPWADKTYTTAGGTVLTALRATMPVGDTQASFIDDYLRVSTEPPPSCRPSVSRMTAISVGPGAHQGLLTTECERQVAFLFAGTGIYIFSVSDAAHLPFLTAFVSTIQLPNDGVNLDTKTWKSFESVRYGYSAKYPSDWAISPAIIDWRFETRFAFWGSAGDGADRFVQSGVISSMRLHLPVFAVTIAAGTTMEDWITAWETPNPGTTPECLLTAADMVPVDIGGHAGLMAPTCTTEAFALVGDRMFVFSLDGPPEILTTFLTTVQLPGG